ncbi:hypothetical protein ACIGEL_19365 [Rossellomorea aquimaris]|uniref:hypothetical protein n=1 Tax=Rossellomorea aquimaris TaxID=189382 RepID=UPI0037CAB339
MQNAASGFLVETKEMMGKFKLFSTQIYEVIAFKSLKFMQGRTFFVQVIDSASNCIETMGIFSKIRVS